MVGNGLAVGSFPAAASDSTPRKLVTAAEAMRTALSGMSTTTAVQRRKAVAPVAQLPDSWLWIPLVRVLNLTEERKD